MSGDGAVALAPDPSTVLDAFHPAGRIADDDRPPMPGVAGTPVAGPTSDRPDHRTQPPAARAHRSGGTRSAGGCRATGRRCRPGFDRHRRLRPPAARRARSTSRSAGELAVTRTPSTSATCSSIGEHADPPALTSILLVAYRNGRSRRRGRQPHVAQPRWRSGASSPTGAGANVRRRAARRRQRRARTADGPDDFVVSDAIASSMIAQLAEQPERRSVLLRLYAGTGPGVGTVDPATLGSPVSCRSARSPVERTTAG